MGTATGVGIAAGVEVPAYDFIFANKPMCREIEQPQFMIRVFLSAPGYGQTACKGSRGGPKKEKHL